MPQLEGKRIVHVAPIILLVAAAWGLVACDAGEAARPAQESDITGERLLATPPPGWERTFELSESDVRLVEFMPADSDKEAWVDKISFESFAGPELPDPIQLLETVARDRKQACTRLEDFNTYSGYENNYPTSVRLFLCHRNKTSGKGEITMVKSIQGNQAFYVIQRSRRVAPYATSEDAPMRNEEMGLWSLYFRSISVCDDTRPDHPCPA